MKLLLKKSILIKPYILWGLNLKLLAGLASYNAAQIQTKMINYKVFLGPFFSENSIVMQLRLG